MLQRVTSRYVASQGMLIAFGVELCGEKLDFDEDIQPLIDRFKCHRRLQPLPPATATRPCWAKAQLRALSAGGPPTIACAVSAGTWTWTARATSTGPTSTL